MALLLTLSAVGAWAVWKWVPHQIQRFEEVAIGRYLRGVKADLAEGKALRNAGALEDAFQLLSRQADDLASYKKLDRLFIWRKRVVHQLLEVAAEMQDSFRANKAVKAYLRDDPKDLPLALRYADLLLEADSEEIRIKGRERYKALFEWLPTVPSIAKGHVEILAQDQDTEAVTAVLTKHLNLVRYAEQAMQNLAFGWYYRQGTDSSLISARRQVTRPQRDGLDLIIPFEVPGAATYIRIDLPSFAVMELSKPRIVIDGEIGSLGEPETAKRAEWWQGQISSDGTRSSWFVYPLPGSSGPDVVKGELRFELAALPKWMEPYLGGEVGRLLQERCIRAQDWQKFALLRDAWIRQKSRKPLRIRGVKGATVHKVYMRKEGQGMAFDCSVPFALGTKELVVVLPLLVGDKLTIHGFELVEEQGERHSYPELLAQGLVLDGLDWVDGIGHVVKDRPQIRWKSQGDLGTIYSLEFEGRIK